MVVLSLESGFDDFHPEKHCRTASVIDAGGTSHFWFFLLKKHGDEIGWKVGSGKRAHGIGAGEVHESRESFADSSQQTPLVDRKLFWPKFLKDEGKSKGQSRWRDMVYEAKWSAVENNIQPLAKLRPPKPKDDRRSVAHLTQLIKPVFE
ncbi:hypothetical protein V6N13_017808 [Hibiscus sabdariffa]